MRRKPTLDIVDKTLILEQGRAKAFGKKDTVFATNEVAQNFLDNQRVLIL